jgi:tetratricopeptide (TPR) repeat protein
VFTTTFYSYKGGVGRTMAVMNTAYRLIAKHKTVFLMDFDLEAPGMDSFFPGQNRDCPGIVEYISAYLDRGEVPSLRDFVVEIPLTDSGPARLFCMRAGRRDANYQTLLARLNWKDFYARSDGFLFVENLKGAIEADYAPDYLLVDSRTGFTDVSGICTLQLPNLVILMFALNEQNLEGTKTIYGSITHNKLNRPIETRLIASPVPDVQEFADLKEKRLLRAKDSLGKPVDLILPYAGFVAFQEGILPPGKSGGFLAHQYGELADMVVAANTTDALTLLKQARELTKAGDLDQADQKYREISEAYPRDPQVWRSYGIFLRGTREPEKALGAFEKALGSGGSEINRADLAITHLVIGDSAKAERKFDEYLMVSKNQEEVRRFAEFFATRDQTRMTIAGYKRLVELASTDQPKLEAALVNLGDLYIRTGEIENAVHRFEEVLRTNPNSLAANYNMAHALRVLGRTADARRYFEASIALSKQTQTQALAPASRANIAQAIGRAYAALSSAEQARESYLAAIQLAEGLGKTSIFSSVSYREIPAEEFTAETRSLLEQLGG